jgi:hypothetical protein
MDVTATGPDLCDVEMTSDEATAFLVEALTRHGLDVDGSIGAQLSVLRRPAEDGPLFFRLAMRLVNPPAAPVEAPDAATPQLDAAPDPTADPSPDAVGAGTDL